MNDQKKPVSSVEVTANPAPSQGRRRLVKGAMLATPVVMTLYSGRLMAQDSISNCVNTSPDASGVANWVSSPDTYQRTPIIVDVYECTNGSQTQAVYFYNGNYYDPAGNSIGSIPPTGFTCEQSSSTTVYQLESYNGKAVSIACWTSLPH